MAAAALLSFLYAAGANVALTPNRKVQVAAPEGLLDDELRTRIWQERDGLVALLERIAAGEEWLLDPSSVASVASAQEAHVRPDRTQRTQSDTSVLAAGYSFASTLLPSVPVDLPQDWQNGLLHLSSMHPLDGFTDKRWALGVWWARRIAYEHGRSAFEMGWDAEDLFGLHPAAPAARYDGMGLAFLLHGNDGIEAICTERATIRRRTTEHRLWRGQRSPETKAAWLLDVMWISPGSSSAKRPRRKASSQPERTSDPDRAFRRGQDQL
jgi:hypothetical protein